MRDERGERREERRERRDGLRRLRPCSNYNRLALTLINNATIVGTK